MIDTVRMARALGGDVRGNSVVCSGPGHTPGDRSLHVTFTSDGDFVVHSFAGDDWRACRDYVRERLGLNHEWPSPRTAALVPMP